MQDFRKLRVWEIAHRLTLDVYRLTRTFPKEELYGLTSQMRRCCASIPANIAEGCGRGSDVEFARFLQIAMGSACELEYFLVLSRDLEFMQQNKQEELTQPVVELKRMLTVLTQKVRTDR
jgi:four helix bundle protein